MKLLLKRLCFSQDFTAGALIWLDNNQFLAATLEDEKRLVKKAAETAIPAGTYEIKLRNEGGLTKKYAAKFPEMHKGMLWLQDVPNFEWVYIHVGNTDDDTEGCILVGTTIDYSLGLLSESVVAYKSIYPIIASAILSGQKVEIEIVDL